MAALGSLEKKDSNAKKPEVKVVAALLKEVEQKEVAEKLPKVASPVVGVAHEEKAPALPCPQVLDVGLAV